tara:strand:+ start:146 stop:622 length:477 start_codon:yes stop_codon:yes gene_type:complete
MKITERRLRRIIRSVILENYSSGPEFIELLQKYNIQLLDPREVIYQGWETEYDQTSWGFEINGEEKDWTMTMMTNLQGLFEMFAFKHLDEVCDLDRISESEYDVLVDGFAKIFGQVSDNHGNNLSTSISFKKDVEEAYEDASNYMAREFGEDDEWNPY